MDFFNQILLHTTLLRKTMLSHLRIHLGFNNVIHTKLDPVLDRCSWEENSSLCIRFRQTKKTTPFNLDRDRIRFLTWEMLNKLQQMCWSDNEPFKIEEINFTDYHTIAYNTSDHKRLEGMITIGL